MPNKFGCQMSDVGFQITNQSGITQILILVLLLAGIAVGTYLVQQKTNLKPKAQEVSVFECNKANIGTSNGSACPGEQFNKFSSCHSGVTGLNSTSISECEKWDSPPIGTIKWYCYWNPAQCNTETYCDYGVNAVRWSANGTVKQACGSNEQCSQDGSQAYCVPATSTNTTSTHCDFSINAIRYDANSAIKQTCAANEHCTEDGPQAICVSGAQQSTTTVCGDHAVGQSWREGCSETTSGYAVWYTCVSDGSQLYTELWRKIDTSCGIPPINCSCVNGRLQGNGCYEEANQPCGTTTAPANAPRTTSTTGRNTGTSQAVSDPPECKTRTSCIYSTGANQCFQGAQIDKTQSSGFNSNCGYVGLCANTLYDGKKVGTSVACPAGGASGSQGFNIRDIPFAGVLLGPDTGTIADLRAEAQKRLGELADLGQSLTSLASKTSDPVVQRLIKIAQGQGDTTTQSINVCLK